MYMLSGVRVQQIPYRSKNIFEWQLHLCEDIWSLAHWTTSSSKTSNCLSLQLWSINKVCYKSVPWWLHNYLFMFMGFNSPYDVKDLMSLINKCCYSTVTFEHHNPDPTLLIGCVPQVYALDELQRDIAEAYLVRKKKLCEIHTLYEKFHFKGHRPILHLSRTMYVVKTFILVLWIQKCLIIHRMASSALDIELFELPEVVKVCPDVPSLNLIWYSFTCVITVVSLNYMYFVALTSKSINLCSYYGIHFCNH